MCICVCVCVCVYIYMYIYVYIVKGDLKAPFAMATIPRCKSGCYSFPWISPLILDLYLIMLSIKQGGIKYHFFESLVWLNPISWAICKPSTHKANGPVCLYMYILLYTLMYRHTCSHIFTGVLIFDIFFSHSVYGLVWFGFFFLMAHQLFLGYLMPKTFS